MDNSLEKKGYEARLHNQVKLLGKSYSVFSNNNVATNYFGREQGFAFPITQLESHKIVEAFGDVFGSSRKRVRTVSDGRKKRIADAVCVWSDDLPQEAEDIIAMRSLDILINGVTYPITTLWKVVMICLIKYILSLKRADMSKTLIRFSKV